MLLISWKDIYGNTDPKVHLDKWWRYSDDEIAAMNASAVGRKIIDSKYQYSKMISNISQQVEDFVSRLYDKYLSYNLNFVKGAAEQLHPGTNVCRWKMVCDKTLAVDIEVVRNWGYHECGLYDYFEVNISPCEYFNEYEDEYLKKVVLSMFENYISESGRKERKRFLDRLHIEV
ncbi:hypothetical protein [Escherichia coli]|uniref:hypothetical protein n=1 Tax=Escherichia coli TaxID=562 RepID=UPI000CFB1C13|nr:hypothetical protein [Escherichia coli]